jgi:hypothetical protein
VLKIQYGVIIRQAQHETPSKKTTVAYGKNLKMKKLKIIKTVIKSFLGKNINPVFYMFDVSSIPQKSTINRLKP